MLENEFGKMNTVYGSYLEYLAMMVEIKNKEENIFMKKY